MNGTLHWLDIYGVALLASFVVMCLLYGAFEWARSKRLERQAREAQRDFWAKANTDAVSIEFKKKENN